MRKFKLVEIDQIEVINLEISKGMYIRTEDGYISKCIDIDSDNFAFFDKPVYKNFSDTFDSCYLNNIDIKKASFNIIDLIEVGDYVNGEKVTSAEPVDKNDTDRYLGFGDYDYYIHDNEDIKDVVTKEQFEAMKYVVERDK